AVDLRSGFCLRVAPQAVAFDEAGRFTRTRGHYGLMPIGPARSLTLARLALLPIALPIVGGANAVNRRRPCNARGLRGIKHHNRLLAFAGLFDRLPQQSAVSGNCLVGGAEVL